MRPLRFILATFLFYFLFTPVYSQNIDSLTRAIDSSSKAFQEVEKSFQNLQDSLYRVQMQRSLDQNSKTLDSFLAGMKEREKKEKQQMYIRLGLGAVFLTVLIIGLARRRKIKRNSA